MDEPAAVGNMGKVLRVDLSSGAHWDETLNSALAENYLACRPERRMDRSRGSFRFHS